jgi:hypothetical protein
MPILQAGYSRPDNVCYNLVSNYIFQNSPKKEQDTPLTGMLKEQRDNFAIILGTIYYLR